MPKKERKFADDGWAVWVDGEDTSTVYINDWLNPKGTSYVDISVRIRGVKCSKNLYVYVPFEITREEMQDTSLLFNDTKILQAIFSAACIIDYKKNAHTSEIAYNGKTMDIVHISTLEYQLSSLSEGTLISINLESLQQFIDNDEAYFAWRMPHKSLNEIFKPHHNMGKTISRIRDLITTPIVSEKYGYSIRINESRLLPEEITRIGAFHRQKLKKAVVTISIADDYEINDVACYKIRRLEEDLYAHFLPQGFDSEDIVTYQWQQTRDVNLKGHFNFYLSISRNSISMTSVFMYMVIIIILNAFGGLMWDIMKLLYGLIFN